MVGELELYVEHGMNPLEALASATVVTAELFGLTDVGLVEEGQLADLLILDGDPVESIGALRSPVAVIIAGRPIAGTVEPILAPPDRVPA
jgi:imidazolonepropionase-like amidohydrolase